MSSHHDNHHNEEPKTVSFRTPMILGLVTLLAIVLLVSTCDKKHDCCEGECEKTEACHGGGHDEHAVAKEEHAAVATTDSATNDADGLEIVDTAEELAPIDSIH